MRCLLFVVAGVLSIAMPAAAGDIFTPILTASNVGEGRNLECRVVNVGTKPLEITSELILDSGIVVSSSTCTVEGGHEGCGSGAGSCSSPAFYCRAYCRFSAKSTRKIRGSIILTPPSTGDAVAALPAF